MEKETRQCQNCKSQFTIEPEDFQFYEKIKVPAPTWCPECRMTRRLLWRNERNLYKIKCDAQGHAEVFLSNYPPNKPFPVVEQAYWWGDGWDPMSYGKDYDFSKTFFEQFKSLSETVPRPNLTNIQCVNSDYSNFMFQGKNCYLVFASDFNEDSSYLYHCVHCKNSYDLLGCNSNEQCYQAVHSHKCYQSAFVYFSTQCLNSKFLYNCHNCQDCFGCVNLRNAKYHIFNQKYSKEEYEQKLKEFETGNFKRVQEIAKTFSDFSLKHPRRFAYLIHSVNSTGDYLSNAKNCKDCFDIEGPIEDSKYVIYGPPNTRDCYDGYGVGENLERAYEVASAGDSEQDVFFSPFIWSSKSCQYSHYCVGSSNLFGCIALRNKQYCILNKQYSKEEYERLVPKIIEHLNAQPYTDEKGRIYKYGEFFPPDVSPFSYNETIAQEYFPLTKNEALAKGYSWRDSEARHYEVTRKPDDLPVHIKDVSDSILEEIIGCAHEGKCHEQCTTAFKIIPQELQFYKKMNLPLPRLCSNCRHYERLKQRNPLKLWHRKCTCGGAASDNEVYQNTAKHFHDSNHCANEFETSYAPERPEIVYCEQCYQAEVV